MGAFQYLLKTINEQKFAEVFSIYYLESRNHKVVLYLKEGELEYYAKIGELEEELAGQFYRIHRGYLVNLVLSEMKVCDKIFHMEQPCCRVENLSNFYKRREVVR